MEWVWDESEQKARYHYMGTGLCVSLFSSTASHKGKGKGNKKSKDASAAPKGKLVKSDVPQNLNKKEQNRIYKKIETILQPQKNTKKLYIGEIDFDDYPVLADLWIADSEKIKTIIETKQKYMLQETKPEDEPKFLLDFFLMIVSNLSKCITRGGILDVIIGAERAIQLKNVLPRYSKVVSGIKKSNTEDVNTKLSEYYREIKTQCKRLDNSIPEPHSLVLYDDDEITPDDIVPFVPVSSDFTTCVLAKRIHNMKPDKDNEYLYILIQYIENSYSLPQDVFGEEELTSDTLLKGVTGVINDIEKDPSSSNITVYAGHYTTQSKNDETGKDFRDTYYCFTVNNNKNPTGLDPKRWKYARIPLLTHADFVDFTKFEEPIHVLNPDFTKVPGVTISFAEHNNLFRQLMIVAMYYAKLDLPDWYNISKHLSTPYIAQSIKQADRLNTSFINTVPYTEDLNSVEALVPWFEENDNPIRVPKEYLENQGIKTDELNTLFMLTTETKKEKGSKFAWFIPECTTAIYHYLKDIADRKEEDSSIDESDDNSQDVDDLFASEDKEQELQDLDDVYDD